MAPGQVPYCPYCGNPTLLVEHEDRHACSNCGRYLPEELEILLRKWDKANEHRHCYRCGRPTRLDADTHKVHCDACGIELPLITPTQETTLGKETTPTQEITPLPAALEAPVCPRCGNGARHIAKYGRDYCDHCRDYLPKDRNATAPPHPGPLPPGSGPPQPPQPVIAQAAPSPRSSQAAGPAASVQRCPVCSRLARYIPKYERYFCNHCEDYLPEGSAPPTSPSPEPASLPVPVPAPRVALSIEDPTRCQRCGSATRYIASYDRHYCDACELYAPKALNAMAPSSEPPGIAEPEDGPAPPCPVCGTIAKYVKKYGRYYCLECEGYVDELAEHPRAKDEVSQVARAVDDIPGMGPGERLPPPSFAGTIRDQNGSTTTLPSASPASTPRSADLDEDLDDLIADSRDGVQVAEVPVGPTPRQEQDITGATALPPCPLCEEVMAYHPEQKRFWCPDCHLYERV